MQSSSLHPALGPFIGLSTISGAHDCCEICTGLKCTLQGETKIYKQRLASCEEWKTWSFLLWRKFESNYRLIPAFVVAPPASADLCQLESGLPCLQWCYRSWGLRPRQTPTFSTPCPATEQDAQAFLQSIYARTFLLQCQQTSTHHVA